MGFEFVLVKRTVTYPRNTEMKWWIVVAVRKSATPDRASVARMTYTATR